MLSMTMIVSQNHVIQCESGGSASAQMNSPGDGVFVAGGTNPTGQQALSERNTHAQRAKDQRTPTDEPGLGDSEDDAVGTGLGNGKHKTQDEHPPAAAVHRIDAQLQYDCQSTSDRLQLRTRKLSRDLLCVVITCSAAPVFCQ